MSGSPVVVTGDVPVLGGREMSPSLSDAQPNFHMTDQPPSKQVSPSASPRIRISFKGDQGGGGGPSEPDSPASINHDAPASTQPGDSNSASTSANSGASQSLAASAVSIPATTLNMPVNGSGSISQPVPLSPSRRPFSFRDVTDINEDSQIRVQSARVHHDEYDRKRTCACCERRTSQPPIPEPEIKQPNPNPNPNPATTSTAEAHATNGKSAEKDKDKDKDKNKAANGTSPASPSSASSPSSSSSQAKKPKSGWGLCGLCLVFRNCMSPEDTEYRCEHGRPCTAENHRHTKGC